MRLANKIFCSLLAVIAMLSWVGCGGGCPTASFGSSSSSGGPSAGKNVGGSACGSGTTPPAGGGNTAAFLYYEGSNSILGASLSTTGTFAAISPFTAPPLPSSAGSDMLIVNKNFLYLPQNDSLTIQAFAIDRTTGALSTISGSPFATFGADSIASDPTGRFLFAGNDTTGQISVFQINATTGALTATPGSPFSAFNLDFAHVLAVDGTGKFLYAGQGSAFLPVYGFSIDQNSGALSQMVGSPFGLNVAGVRTDFSGKYAIGISGLVGDKSLYVFAIDPTTGALASVAGSPFLTVANQLFDLKVHSSSQFVYSFGEDVNANITSIEGFSLNPISGTLSPLAGSPFTTVPIVADCKWDQGGGEAFCASATGGAFTVLDTNVTTGALSHTVTDLSVTSSSVAFAPTD